MSRSTPYHVRGWRVSSEGVEGVMWRGRLSYHVVEWWGGGVVKWWSGGGYQVKGYGEGYQVRGHIAANCRLLGWDG